MSGNELTEVGSEKLIHLTTTGRKTGKLHTVELWFAIDNGKIYLSHEGEETDWMKNIERDSHVSFVIGNRKLTGVAHYLRNGTKEAEKAKESLYKKYYGKAGKEIIDDWFSLSRLLVIEL
jgi:general stress protein 26